MAKIPEKSNKENINNYNSENKSDNDEVIKINIGGIKSPLKNVPKHNWAVTTYILGILSIILLITLFLNNGSEGFTGNVVNQNDMKQLVDNFINQELVPGGDVAIESISEQSGLYVATISSNGETVPLYFTKDGNFISPGRPLVPIKDSGSLNNNLPSDNSNNNDNIPSTPSADVSADDDPVLGNANAPVTIIEFSDYQCPFCERFFTSTLPQIKKDYIDTGKAKLVYRDFPLSSIHPYAQKAAEAAECAGEQGNNFYWKMHDKLFGNQNALDIESLKKYAQEISLDTNKFNTCLDSGAMAQEVSKDTADGTSYGVQGTPAFFINGQEISGAQPFESFKSIIDAELANA
ncbi:DsbA family protein [Candidatus Pacearchaeota archaeon]|nr:DsbA family protein [Candidatus Pacearchaeota archaeon]